MIDAAQKRNIAVLPILDYAPAFAKPAQCHPEEWRRFVTAVVSRYGKRCGVFEVWNEANNSAFWPPRANADEYADFLKATYQTIKAVDPSVKVAIGGFARVPLNFVERVYRRVGKDSFDIMNVHPYTQPERPEGRLDVMLESLRELMARYGDAEKPIWVTEIGWPTHAVPLDGATLRACLAAAKPEQTRWTMLYAGLQHEPDDPDNRALEALRAALPVGSTAFACEPERIADMLTGEKKIDAVFFPLSENYPADAWKAVMDFVHRGGVLVDFGGVPVYGAMARNAQGNFVIRNDLDRAARFRALKLAISFPTPASTPERYFLPSNLAKGDDFIPLRRQGTNVLTAVWRYADGGAFAADGTMFCRGPLGEGAVSSSDELRQARMLVRALAILGAEGVAKVMVYELSAPERDPTDPESHFGLTHRQLKPKPAFEALKAWAKVRPGGSISKPGAWHSTDRSLYFPQWTQPDGTKVGCIWSTRRQSLPVKLHFEISNARPTFADWQGNPLKFEVDNENNLTIPLTSTPIYIKNAFFRED